VTKPKSSLGLSTTSSFGVVLASVFPSKAIVGLLVVDANAGEDATSPETNRAAARMPAVTRAIETLLISPIELIIFASKINSYIIPTIPLERKKPRARL
jgi:hypothetical protein